MKTSLNDLRRIEKYLSGEVSPEISLLFQATMVIDRALQWNVLAQKKLHALILFYHRKKLKEEIAVVSEQLFADPGKSDFQKRIRQIFKN